MNELQKLETWRKDLAIAETYEQFKVHESAAAAMKQFSEKMKMAKSKQNEIGRYAVEIESKKGGWLDKHFPSKGNEYSAGRQKRPAKMPATKDESSQATEIENYILYIIAILYKLIRFNGI